MTLDLEVLSYATVPSPSPSSHGKEKNDRDWRPAQRRRAAKHKQNVIPGEPTCETRDPEYTRRQSDCPGFGPGSRLCAMLGIASAGMTTYPSSQRQYDRCLDGCALRAESQTKKRRRGIATPPLVVIYVKRLR
jgi:hypothetical protein